MQKMISIAANNKHIRGVMFILKEKLVSFTSFLFYETYAIEQSSIGFVESFREHE